MPDPAAPGLLLIGHGTREPRGIAEFRALVEQVSAALPTTAVEPCFLELSRPTILEGVERLTQRQVRHVQAMPVLLFAAGHVRRDIPRALQVAAEQTGVEIQPLPHFGCHEDLVALSAQRYREALSRHHMRAEDQTVLVLVGRGSRDPRATAEMREFAERRFVATPVARLEVAFLAMERPRLAEVLAGVGASQAPRIVVQPHLLFAGSLVQQVQAEVRRAAQHWPGSHWIVAEPLGSDRRLAQVVGERFLAGTAVAEPHTAGGRRTG